MDVHKFWIPKINALTLEPLQGDNLDRYYVSRPDTPLNELISQLDPDLNIRKILFSGHRGNGKSSELYKLEKEVADKLFVCWLDVEKMMDLNTVNYLDILVFMGVSAYYNAEERGEKLDESLMESLLYSVSTLICEETDTKDFKVDPGKILNLFKMGGVLNLATGAYKVESLRREVPPRVGEVIDRINQIFIEVEKRVKKPPILIVDGLDKAPLDRARELFARSQHLSKPSCRIIYTAPLSLFYSANFQQAKQQFLSYELPNVKWRNRDKEPYEKGREILKEIVIKRIGSDAISPTALDFLVDMSGGVMRHLIELVERAAIKAKTENKTKINEEEAKDSIFDLKKTFEVRDNYIPHLNRVIDTHRRISENITVDGKETALSDSLVENLFILRYYDIESREYWWDVHPVVYEILESFKKFRKKKFRK